MARKDFDELSKFLNELVGGLNRVKSEGMTEFSVKDVLRDVWDDEDLTDTQKRNIGSHFHHLVNALKSVEFTGQDKPLAHYRLQEK